MNMNMSYVGLYLYIYVCIVYIYMPCVGLGEQVMRQMEKSCWTLMIVSLYSSLVINIFVKLSRKTVIGLTVVAPIFRQF